MPMRYLDRRYRKLPVVRVLFATNMVFALAVLIAWQLAVLAVLGPLGWAADQPIPTAQNFENLFRYPLVIFWAGPALAMVVAWLLMQAHNHKAAFGVLIVPVLMTVLLIGVFFLTPNNGF
jgi:hypothetical protein